MAAPVQLDVSSKPEMHKTDSEKLWAAFTPQTDFETYGSVASISYFPDKHPILVANSARISLFSLEAASFVSHIQKFSHPVQCARYRSDGNLFVTGDESGLVQVFSTATKSWTKRWYDLTTPCFFVDFSPDGTLVLAASRSGRLLVWNLASDVLVFGVHAHKDSIRSASVLDGSHVVTTSYDGSVKIWNYRSGVIEEKASEDPKGHNRQLTSGGTAESLVGEFTIGSPIEACSYHQETRTLFIASPVHIHVLSISPEFSMEEKARSDAIPKGVTSLLPMTMQQVPYLLAGCVDGTVRVFTADTLNAVLTLCNFSSSVLSLCLHSYDLPQKILLPHQDKRKAGGQQDHERKRYIIYAGRSDNTFSVIAQQRLADIQECFVDVRQTIDPALAEKALLRTARKSIDLLLNEPPQRPRMGKIDSLLLGYHHINALEMALAESPQVAAACIAELEARGPTLLENTLAQISEGSRMRLLEYCSGSFGSLYLAGPLLRATEICVAMTVENGVPQAMHAPLLQFNRCVEEELSAIKELIGVDTLLTRVLT